MGTDPKYMFVRAMGQTSAEFNLFFEKSVVAVGWSGIDFSAYDSVPDLVKTVVERYESEAAPQVVGRKRNEVRRFKSIQRGDRILVPYWSSVRLAVAEDDELYDPDAGKELDLANQRKVSYLKEDDGTLATVPRRELGEALQRRLRVRGTTVSNLVEFADEIEGLFSSEGRGWSTRVQEEVEQQAAEFRATLLENIRHGRTSLEAGGRGLEELVRALLEIEGYEAEILSKRAFPGSGDADIAASRADRFSESKLLVQVKHHRGTSSSYGAEQLIQIIETQPDEYADYQLVVVTTGEPSPDLGQLCEDRDIAFLSGNDLVAWIAEALEDLPVEWRTILGISQIPRMAV